MSKHLERDIDGLKKSILDMGRRVERALADAVEALNERNAELARRVIDGDRQIDSLEVEIEEECLKILALHHPVSDDLRFIASVIKINNDLERVGDLAANIAERALYVMRTSAMATPVRLRAMGEGTVRLLAQSLTALVERDPEAASRVRADDDVIDQYQRDVLAELREVMREHPELLDPTLHLFTACRNLERVADHATNVAEDVIYVVEGIIVRHHAEPQELRTRR